MLNYTTLCKLPSRFCWHYLYLPFLGAVLLFLLLWAGLSDAILDVIEVFAVGAVLSRIITHYTTHKDKGFKELGRLPLRLLFHTCGVFWMVNFFSNSPILPLAWFLGTYDDLVDLFVYCLQD